MRIGKIILLVTAISLFGSSWQTSEASTDNFIRKVVGSWAFKTTEYREGSCTMQGNMKVSRQNAEEYYCEIYAEETCTMWGVFLVYQTCTIDQADDQITIVSKVEKIIESTMELSEVNYIPDNFIVEFVDPNLMTGNLVSAVIAPVRFERVPDNNS